MRQRRRHPRPRLVCLAGELMISVLCPCGTELYFGALEPGMVCGTCERDHNPDVTELVATGTA